MSFLKSLKITHKDIGLAFLFPDKGYPSKKDLIFQVIFAIMFLFFQREEPARVLYSYSVVVK